jgi:hypothetical protein
MDSPHVFRMTAHVLLAVVLFGSFGLRAADEEVAPATGKLEVKVLLDQALADLDDPAAKQAVLRELHDVFPAQLAELQGVADSNGEAATDTARQLVGQAKHLVDLKRDDPREYERVVRLCRLDDECLDLVRKARAAEGEARAPLVASLRQKLGEAFDAKQDTMNREVAAMAGELENLRRRVAKRAESREQLIDRRVLDLLSDREAEW